MGQVHRPPGPGPGLLVYVGPPIDRRAQRNKGVKMVTSKKQQKTGWDRRPPQTSSLINVGPLGTIRLLWQWQQVMAVVMALAVGGGGGTPQRKGVVR